MESEFSRGTFLRWSTPFLQWNSRLCRDTKSSRRFWGLHNAQGSNGFLEKSMYSFQRFAKSSNIIYKINGQFSLSSSRSGKI